MAAQILIVEDEDEFVEEITQVLKGISPSCVIFVAQSRDAAFNLLNTNFFDVIILDLKIPTANGELDSDPQHGQAVFGRAQSVTCGTPIFVLTGSSAEDFISTMLDGKRHVDVWGEGKDVSTVEFLQKYRLDRFPEKVGPSLKAVDALAEVELDRTDVDLTIAEDRLIRIFSRRFGGTRVVASRLGGGLSGAKVLRLRVTDSNGAPVHDAVAKIGSVEIIKDEVGRFDSHISRLEGGATPRKLATFTAGAGSLAGVFYGLAAGFERSAFQAATPDAAHAAAVIASVENGTKRWRDGVQESRRTVQEVRRRMLTDQALGALKGIFNLEWTADFESKSIQNRWCCIHGDLHGENVLVAQNGAAVIIDFGEVGDGPASLDPVTLELSLLFHPSGPLRTVQSGFSAWPTEAQAREWGNIENYLTGCPSAAFIRECRVWGLRVAGGKREVAASAYAYLVRQLKYQDSNKELALALLEGVRSFYDET